MASRGEGSSFPGNYEIGALGKGIKVAVQPSTGNVGINTRNPQEFFTVAGTSQTSNLHFKHDVLLDADGSSTSDIGSPDVIAENNTLTTVESADNICSNSAGGGASNIFIDSGGDCDVDDSDTHTVLVGSLPAGDGTSSADATLITSSDNWSYLDNGSTSGAYDDGEDLYFDSFPSLAYNSGSIQMSAGDSMGADGLEIGQNRKYCAESENECSYIAKTDGNTADPDGNIKIGERGDDDVFNTWMHFEGESGHIGVGTSKVSDGQFVLGNDVTDEAYMALQPAGNAENDFVGLQATESGNNTTKLHLGREFTSDSTFQSQVTLESETGRVGVGTTSPQELLHSKGVKGQIALTDTDNFTDTADYIYLNPGSNDLRIGWNDVSAGVRTDILHVESNGRVGIGTTNPSYNLDISPSSGHAQARIRTNSSGNNTYLRMQVSDDTASNQIYFGDSTDSNVGSLQYHHNSDIFRIITNASEQLRVDSLGRLGIGETSPGAKLVVGDGSTTANVRMPLGSMCIDSDGTCSAPSSGGLRLGAYGIDSSDDAAHLNIQDAIDMNSNTIFFEEAGGDSLKMGRDDSLCDENDCWHIIKDDSGDGEPDGDFDIAGSGTNGFNSWMHFEGSNGRVGVNTTSPASRLTVSGDVRAHDFITDTSADVAEHYPAAGTVEAGDVVRFTPRGKLARTITAADPTIAGVISTNPGVTLAEQTGSAPLALTGRVPVKVTNAGGRIDAGDYLTSSDIPGVARKATEPGMVIGRALEPHTGRRGTIEVYVNTQYYHPAIEATAQSTDGGFLHNGDSAEFADLAVSGSTRLDGPLTVTGTTTLDSLTVTRDATFQEELTVRELDIDTTLTVGGHIISRGGQPEVAVGEALQRSEAGEQFTPAETTIEGSDTAGTISLVTNDASGRGVLAKVIFSQEFGDDTPRILLTAGNGQANDVQAYIDMTSVAAESFTIQSGEPLEQDSEYIFNYFVIESAGSDQ